MCVRNLMDHILHGWTDLLWWNVVQDNFKLFTLTKVFRRSMSRSTPEAFPCVKMSLTAYQVLPASILEQKSKFLKLLQWFLVVLGV